MYLKLHILARNDGEQWSRNFYFKIPPCGKMVIFVTEFVIWGKNLPFYKAVENNIPHGGISKKRKKSRPLFTIIFRPKETILDTYSILNL